MMPKFEQEISVSNPIDDKEFDWLIEKINDIEDFLLKLPLGVKYKIKITVEKVEK